MQVLIGQSRLVTAAISLGTLPLEGYFRVLAFHAGSEGEMRVRMQFKTAPEALKGFGATGRLYRIDGWEVSHDTKWVPLLEPYTPQQVNISWKYYHDGDYLFVLTIDDIFVLPAKLTATLRSRPNGYDHVEYTRTLNLSRSETDGILPDRHRPHPD